MEVFTVQLGKHRHIRVYYNTLLILFFSTTVALYIFCHFRENVDKLLSQAYDTAFIPLQGFLLSGSSQSKAPFLMQLKSIAAIRETLMVTEEVVILIWVLFVLCVSMRYLYKRLEY